jgi:hypothetical protein
MCLLNVELHIISPSTLKIFEALLSHSAYNGLVVNYRSTFHMAKDSFLLTCLDESKERKIYVIDYFSLGFVGQGDVTCRRGNSFNIYHFLNLISNVSFFA